MKNDHRWNIPQDNNEKWSQVKYTSGQQYLLNDTKKFRQKWSKFVWRKKKPTPSTNIPLLSYRKSEQKVTKFTFRDFLGKENIVIDFIKKIIFQKILS